MSKRQKQIEETINKLLSEDQDTVLKAVLENLSWPREVKTDTEYFVREDDCDGARKGISVSFLCNGDSVIDFNCCFESHYVQSGVFSTPHVLRFRTFSGGSMNPLIQKAVLVLAFTIATNPDEENPIV